MAKGKCRITGNDLLEVIDFGSPYVSNYVDSAGQGDRFPLRLGISRQSDLIQLLDTFPAEKMYCEQYWYQSGINPSMCRALEDVVHGACRWVSLNPGDVVLDIGCNDGTLLGYYPWDVERIGFDPAAHLVCQSLSNIDVCVNDFFSVGVYHQCAARKAKIITAIAMFYDIEDPVAWTRDLARCLDDSGILVIQQSYVPLMLVQNAFDNICHEHLTYQSLDTMQLILRGAGLKIIDVELNNINGGSFRIYACKDPEKLSVPTFDLDIGRMRVNSLLAYEQRRHAYGQENLLLAFVKRIQNLRDETTNLLWSLANDGKVVVGVGASTKGNTLLQYYGITPGLLPAIAERTPSKVGKLTVGSNIPIISELKMRKMKPDYLFCLPWHYIESIRKRESELLAQGTKLIMPLPTLKIFE